MKKVLYARDKIRNNSLDFIQNYITLWSEIYGDRLSGDDASIRCGFGKLGDLTIAIAAQHTGHTFEERLKTHNGSTKAMGYRKMQRLLKIAEQWSLPLLCLIDTPGADASLQASLSNQSKAIADNLVCMAAYPFPSISVIMNQGMSGGAMALAMADRLWMIEHAIFSVISPEGCAKIIWRDIAFAANAAEILKMTAIELAEMKIIDEILPDNQFFLKQRLMSTFVDLAEANTEQRLYTRYHRWDKQCT